MTDETTSNSDANDILTTEEVERLLGMMSDGTTETSVRGSNNAQPNRRWRSMGAVPFSVTELEDGEISESEKEALRAFSMRVLLEDGPVRFPEE